MRLPLPALALGVALATACGESSPPWAAVSPDTFKPPQTSRLQAHQMLPDPDNHNGFRPTDIPCHAEVSWNDDALIISTSLVPGIRARLHQMPGAPLFFRADLEDGEALVVQFQANGMLRAVSHTNRDASGELRYGKGHHGMGIMECF